MLRGIARLFSSWCLGRRARLVLPCSKPWSLGAAALIAIGLACVSDAPLGPSESAVRIVLHASVVGQTAGDAGLETVHIRVFYRRTTGEEFTLPARPDTVSVTPGTTTSQAVEVAVRQCIADTQRESATITGCLLHVTLRLVDQTGVVIDSQVTQGSEPTPPGGTASLPDVAIGITVASLALSQSAVTLSAGGPATTLTAVPKDARGNVLNGRVVTWSVSDPAVAQLSSTATTSQGDTGATVQLTGLKKGTVSVTAASGSASGAPVSVAVTPGAPATLTVAVSRSALTIGEQTTATAQLADKNGDLLAAPPSGATLSWHSSAEGVATVSPTGPLSVQVTGVGQGRATITASLQFTSGNGGSLTSNGDQSVTVTPPQVQSTAIVLTPGSVDLGTIQQGSAAPQARTIAVSTTAGGTLTGLSTGRISYSGAASEWLQASVSPAIATATAPATLSVHLTTTALAPGSYTATVPVIAAGGASNSPQDVPVNLVVTAVPMIVLSPTSVSFPATQRAAARPGAQSDTITNGAPGGSLAALGTLSVSGVPAWLSDSLNSATGVLILVPNTSDLAPGNYSASLTVSSSVSGVKSVTLAVAYSITPPPEPLTVTLSGTGTGTVTSDPAGIDCSITNGERTGTCTATFAVGTPLTLTETPGVQSVFDGWGGACGASGADAQCQLTIDIDTLSRSVGASFRTIVIGSIRAAPTVQFGGDSLCTYNAYFGQVGGSLKLTNNLDTGSSPLTSVDNEARAAGNCPFPVIPANSHKYSVKAIAVAGSSIKIDYAPDSANQPQADLQFTGIISGDDQTISGTLTRKRTEPITASSVLRTITTNITLLASQP